MSGDTSVGKLDKTSFWKNLVSSDPIAELDENGDPIPGTEPEAKPTISNFSMVKKMMRLK